MVPANRPLRIVTKSGETIDGRRLNEDTYTVQLLDARGRLRSLAKSDIRTLDVRDRVARCRRTPRASRRTRSRISSAISPR